MVTAFIASLCLSSQGLRPHQAPDDKDYQQIVSDIADRDKTREAVLEEAKNYVKNHPTSKHAEDARDIVTVLGAQIRENAAHVKPDPKTASKDQMIAEWVFELQYVGRPNFGRGKMPSANQIEPKLALVDAGWDAVPALIAALDDRRFTFQDTIGFGVAPGQGGPHRVRDEAIEVLDWLSGIFFSRQQDGSALDDASAWKAKIDVSAWWKSASQMSEVAYVDQAVRSGDERFPSLVSRLVRLAPKQAMAAILAGFDRVQNPYQRNSAFNAIQALRTKEATEFLRDQATHGESRLTRLFAGSALAQTDVAAGQKAMAAVLAMPDTNLMDDFTIDMQVMNFAIKQSIPILDTHWSSLNADRKAQLLTGSAFQHPMWMNPSASAAPMMPTAADRPALIKEAEDFLAHRLTDTSRSPSSMNVNNERFDSPRIADIACSRLASLFPDAYHYAPAVTDQESERQARATLNVWRTRRGMKSLPELAASTKPANADGKMAMVVREVTEVGSRPATNAVELPKKGDQLTEEGLRHLIREFRSAPKGTLSVNREADFAGISIRVDYSPTVRAEGGLTAAFASNLDGKTASSAMTSYAEGLGKKDPELLVQLCGNVLHSMFQTDPKDPFNFFLFSNPNAKPPVWVK